MYNQLKNRMKRTLILFALIAACLSFTQPMMAQDAKAKITLSFKGEALPAVFAKLEKASSYKFNFAYDDVAAYNYNGNISGKTVTEALNAILSGKPFTYNVKGSIITITKQERKMTEIGGFVINSEDKEPVIGAQVKIVGTQVATVTDINGAFRFNYTVSENTLVEVSYVGMKTTQVKAGDNMKIVLMSDSKELDNVVVTGIFQKARESYTGSVSTISSEQIAMYKNMNLLQTLKNIDASLNFAVNNIAGSNPNNLPQINIRGNASLPTSVEEFNAGNKNNPNTPLIILDGFEISLTDLMDFNDEEILSINILKDASATAIYGSRGANGVIVVTTKKPEAGRLKLNVEIGTDLELPDLSSYHMLNAAEKLEVERRAGLYDHNYQFNNQQEMLMKQAYYDRLRVVQSGVNTDWLSIPLRNGLGQNYKARLEGGSNEFRWAASLNYHNVAGAMKGSSRETFTGALNLLYKVKNVTFQNKLSYTINNSEESKYGSFSTYVNQQPYDAAYDADGNLRRYFDPFWAWAGKKQNPLYDAQLNSFNTSKYNKISDQFSIDWNIFKDLSLRGQVGMSRTENNTDYFLPSEHSYFTVDHRSEYSTPEGRLRAGIYRYGQSVSTDLNANATLYYNHVFAEKHSLYVGADMSVLTNTSDGFRFAVEGFNNDDMAKIGNALQYAQNERPSGSNSTVHQFGLTGNVNYTYDNRYYVDASYRVDGSSAYGSNKKYAPFWSVGLGWNIHREKFLADNEVISMLRLKTSLGETGSATGASLTDAFTYFNYVSGNRYAGWTGAILGGWGNPDLTWQKTKEFNVGTEFSLWKNRIKGSFDYYVKTTSNLLSAMNTPSSMGFPSYMANVGEVRNNGWEAMLSGYVVRDQKHDFNVMLTAQLVYNKNKITKLSEAIKAQNDAYMKQAEAADGSSLDIQNLFYEGNPQNAIYAVRSLGIDPSTGREIFLDRNGKRTDTWNAADKVCLGSADPEYRGNASALIMWKNWQLNIAMRYWWGGKTYNSTLRDRVEVDGYSLMDKNADSRVLSSRWYKEGDVVFFKALSYSETRSTSRYVMDDNVLELSNISLQYKLKNKWLENTLRCNTIIFGVSMNDIAHWSSIRMERGTGYPYARNVQGSIKLLF